MGAVGSFNDSLYDSSARRALAERLIYASSLACFAASSLLLGLDLALAGISCALFAWAFFRPGRTVAFASLASYLLAVALSTPSFGMPEVLGFGFFSLLPFLFLFRGASAPARGFAPVEPLGALVPVMAAAFLAISGSGAFFSSTDSILPGGIVLSSFLALLAAMLALPLASAAIRFLSRASRASGYGHGPQADRRNI
jgi:hypothetical protein